MTASDGVPTRPALRWHGGKWRLAPWIIGHFPPHRIYVEPFGGAASVLLRKVRSDAEIWGDLDKAVVGLFRTLQNPAAATRLIELLRLTPFAREEFKLSNQPSDDPIERARRLIIRAFMGFGSNAHNERGMQFRACVREDKLRPKRSATGFRANGNGNNTTPAHDWANYPDALLAVVERFMRVVIESRPALEVMAQHDDDDVLHYCDPPYLPETRRLQKKKGGPGFLAYAHELDRGGHVELLGFLCGLKGMVALSGYPSELYDQELPGWDRYETKAHADGARPRIEVLWLNPACAAALKRQRAGAGTPLFPHVEKLQAAE